MAILTLSEAKIFAGITTTDPVRDAALATIVQEACDAVIRYCNNGNLEATEYTQILDAAPTPALILPFAPVIYDPDGDPARDFQLYRRETANGDPSAFTSDDLLTLYQDYTLDWGPTNATTSENGIVRFLNRAAGVGFERPFYSLAVKLVPIRGAFKVVYTAGYDPAPASLKMAVNLIVRKIFHARKLGVPLTNESLNGYAYGTQQSATADGVLRGDPTIRGALQPFCRPQIGGYY